MKYPIESHLECTDHIAIKKGVCFCPNTGWVYGNGRLLMYANEALGPDYTHSEVIAWAEAILWCQKRFQTWRPRGWLLLPADTVLTGMKGDARQANLPGMGT